MPRDGMETSIEDSHEHCASLKYVSFPCLELVRKALHDVVKCMVEHIVLSAVVSLFNTVFFIEREGSVGGLDIFVGFSLLGRLPSTIVQRKSNWFADVQRLVPPAYVGNN